MTFEAIPQTEALHFESANDRFKRSFSSWLWGSVIAATVLHFAVFAFWPEMQAADFSLNESELETIELPPEIEIPPPPEKIARPATPVISDANIDEDITIAPTTFDDNPIEDLPPPPLETNNDVSSAPTFTPYTVAPELKNREEVRQALKREYPPLLRDAQIGGSVLVHFFIDETGKVVKTLVEQSSGHAQFDNAALTVADLMDFTPAMNRDRYVPVWIVLPITFAIR